MSSTIKSYNEQRAFAASVLSNGTDDVIANFSPALNEMNKEQKLDMIKALSSVVEYLKQGVSNEENSNG
jgi:ABC-type enterochelin transport system ATPase subunit